MKKEFKSLKSLCLRTKLGIKGLAIAGIMLASANNNANAQGSLSTGLIHHYCFDGDASDKVGVNHGTPMNGASLVPSVSPSFGTAYNFDGVDDYIDLPADVWVNGDFTISGWLYVRASSTWGRFFDFGNGSGVSLLGDDNIFYSTTAGTGPNGVYRNHHTTCAPLTLAQDVWSGATPIGRWIFVTVVQSGSTGTVYMDGAFVSTATVNAPCNIVRTLCYFGRSNWAGDDYFDGKMDDIRIYERALNANEVSELHNLTGSCDPYASANCNDTCYWRVTGNNILAPSRNILGTMSNDDVRLFTNGSPRGILSGAGDFGWNTMTPTAKLHVDVTSLTPTTGIRFEGLLTNADSSVLTVDAFGNVHTMPYPYGGGISSTCAAIGFVPKTSSSSGDLVCSQIFDNGTSVGIATTGGFTYTSFSGARLGSIIPTLPPPPATGIIKFEVNGVGRSLANIVTSDGKFKSNVNSIPNPLEIIKLIDGKVYTWNSTAQQTLGADNGLHIGYIAQDLQKVIPEVVITDNEGNLGVNYTEIIPILSEAIKEQQKQIEELKELIKLNSINRNNESGTATDGHLDQNAPNPFSVSTIIGYELPKGTQKAAIGIYDMNGKEVKLVQLPSDKKGLISIQGGDLIPGMYIYTLIVDGKYFDSKKMILTSQ